MTPVMPRFNDIGQKACPGSYVLLREDHRGKRITCPFCHKSPRVNLNNTVRAHRK